MLWIFVIISLTYGPTLDHNGAVLLMREWCAVELVLTSDASSLFLCSQHVDAAGSAAGAFTPLTVVRQGGHLTQVLL